MKLNLSLLVLALACISVAHAQTEKGTRSLGFSVNYLNQKNESADSQGEDKIKNFGIGPTFSYFISDRIDLGFALSYGRQDQKRRQGDSFYDGQESRQYGASVFLRKHMMFSDQFGLSAGPFLTFVSSESTVDYDDFEIQNSKTNSFQGGINLGVEYFPTKKIGIAANLANLAYTHSRKKFNQMEESVTKTNSFQLDVTEGLNLSIFFVFGAK